MTLTAPRYGFLLLAAPLVGIVVSRISASVDGPERAGNGADDQCVEAATPFFPLRQTSILRPPKQQKVYPAFWRASKRSGQRKLITTLYSVHLDEAVPILDGQQPPADILNRFYRCRGFGTVYPVDARLTEAVVAAAAHFSAGRVEIISAYRSTKFNDSLAKKGRYVAAESKHTKGMAIDFRVVNTPAKTVGNWMFEHFEGGVGTYIENDFVHIDTGAKRRWRGR